MLKTIIATYAILKYKKLAYNAPAQPFNIKINQAKMIWNLVICTMANASMVTNAQKILNLYGTKKPNNIFAKRILSKEWIIQWLNISQEKYIQAIYLEVYH